MPVHAELQTWPIDLAKVLGPVALTPGQLRCHLRELTANELRQLKDEPAKSIPDRLQKNCQVGDKVFLYSFEPRYQRRSLRVLAERSGDGQLVPVSQILPERSIEAPWCPSCDAIWMGALPERSETFDHGYYLQNYEPAEVESPPIMNFKKLGLTLHPVAEQLKGRRFAGNILVADALPTNSRTQEIVRSLKARGAKRVVWLWAGLRSYRKHYYGELPYDAKTLSWSDYEKKARSGQIVIDAASKHPFRFRIFPWAVNAADFLKNAKDVDKQRELLIYGQDPYDRDGLYVLHDLRKLGFRKLHYYPGGTRGWLER